MAVKTRKQGVPQSSRKKTRETIRMGLRVEKNVGGRFKQKAAGEGVSETRLAEEVFSLYLEGGLNDPGLRLPVIAAPCVPWNDAVKDARRFTLGADYVREFDIQETDAMIRVGDSVMISLDVLENIKFKSFIIVRPGVVPKKHEVTLYAMQLKDGRSFWAIKNHTEDLNEDVLLIDGEGQMVKGKDIETLTPVAVRCGLMAA